MASRSGKGYWFGSPWILSLIIAIIPVLNWWMGVIHRLVKGNYLGALLFVFFGWFLGFVDFVTVLLGNEVSVLA